MRAMLAATVLVALCVSGLQPHDRPTWWLEVAPVLLAAPVLWFTRKRFPLTMLLCVLLCVHALVLIVGGHYTYARVPAGFRVAEWFGWERNPYDKLGHFLQGFVPAIVAREVLLRGRFVRGRGMLAFLIVCIALAISATYELVEWGAALALGQGAEQFLGTQGDPWDTHSDMGCALLGALCALLLLSRAHDRALRRLLP